MGHAQVFEFERGFVADLQCIPMAVRFKLDRCGVKLPLEQWSAFTLDERHRLLAAPCEAADAVESYRRTLADLVRARFDAETKPLPAGSTVPWEQDDHTPPAITACARSVGAAAPADTDWRRLSGLQRFALLKLARDNHDNVNFLPAMREFGLAREARSADVAAAS